MTQTLQILSECEGCAATLNQVSGLCVDPWPLGSVFRLILSARTLFYTHIVSLSKNVQWYCDINSKSEEKSKQSHFQTTDAIGCAVVIMPVHFSMWNKGPQSLGTDRAPLYQPSH